MSNAASRPEEDIVEPGPAEDLRDSVSGTVRPVGGSSDRAGAYAVAKAGMSNEPIPIPNDEPEVGLTTPVED